MNLETNIAINTYGTGGVKTNIDIIVKGELLQLDSLPNGDKRGHYKYSVDGKEIESGSSLFLAADVQALYDAVKSTLPADTDYNLREYTLYYEAFKVKMIEKFIDLTSTSQIDLVV